MTSKARLHSNPILTPSKSVTGIQQGNSKDTKLALTPVIKPVVNTQNSPKNVYIWLETHLEPLNPRSKLFRLLKDTLKPQGYWRNKPRGNPKAGFKAGYGRARDVD